MSNESKIATIGKAENVSKKFNVSEKFFEIPPYQRLYEWEYTQIEELLNDMKKVFDLDKEKAYFIGNITTSIDKNDSNKFILIDGQQRLATLWFIGFYLASKGCNDWKNFITQDDKLRIAMPIRDNEEKTLKELARKITEPKDKEGKCKLADLLPSNIHAKIKKAFECIETWFHNVENIQENKLQDFANFIYTKVCFVFVELAENTDLNRFFVRMNNRGKQLEKHEILKARILHKISEKEREKYAEIWDLCSDMNRYIFQSKDSEIYEVESIIDFPTFLLHCFKIFMIDNLPQNFTISKDKLLEFIDIKKLTWEDKNCIDFIESMLRYRVLFDGFVIKSTTKKGKETSEKESPYKIKRLSTDDNLVNSNLNDLEMIQNYLRVARQGERQNYHHWLTPFLKFLSENQFLECRNKDSQNKQQKVGFFQSKAENLVEQLKTYCIDEMELKCVDFLENLDTKLAIAQLSKQDNKDSTMLTITNEVLKKLDSVKDFKANEDDKWDFLKYGNDIRYWFYRLEYYLWKDGVENEKNLNIRDTNFSIIRNNFYFRNLGSIEHFQPQSEPDEKWWISNKSEMDTFGNLALISRSLNSSLGKQNLEKKEIDIAKEGNSESLKLVLMCCLKNLKNNDNTETKSNSNAQEHQKQMIVILKESLGLKQKDS